jgi:arabinofuranosyltransferase
MVFLLALVLLAYVVAVNAWVCDDAYITLRTVDNAVSGHGLTWNPGERVQAYTHPLWMLLLIPAYAVTGDAYWSVLGLSFASSLGTVLVLRLFTRAEGAPRLALAVLLLASSKAFVDYTTSGLESPLSYLLLAAFFGPLLLSDRRPEELGERGLVGLVLVGSLAAVNRLDTFLLYLPGLVFLVAAHRRRPRLRLLALLALGLLPLLAWEAFSLVYYGFPFPNTAYAKLYTGLPASTLLEQGLHYFANSLRWDPLTLALCGAAMGVAAARRHPASLAGALGIALYLVYAARVGGDFMSGRFFAAPCLLACLVLVPALRGRTAPALAVAAAVAVLALHPAAPLRTTRGYQGLGIDEAGVGDERGQYFEDSGLLFYRPGVFPHSHWMWAGLRFSAEPTRVRFRKNTGYFGFAAGPEKTLIDPYALSDPLLARLPIDPGTSWRIGHFARTAPEGYQESLLTGENRIADPDLRVYYEKLRLVVSGPVFGRERLATVLAFNLGSYDGYRDRYLSRRRSGSAR